MLYSPTTSFPLHRSGNILLERPSRPCVRIQGQKLCCIAVLQVSTVSTTGPEKKLGAPSGADPALMLHLPGANRGHQYQVTYSTNASKKLKQEGRTQKAVSNGTPQDRKKIGVLVESHYVEDEVQYYLQEFPKHGYEVRVCEHTDQAPVGRVSVSNPLHVGIRISHRQGLN